MITVLLHTHPSGFLSAMQLPKVSVWRRMGGVGGVGGVGPFRKLLAKHKSPGRKKVT